MSNYLIELSKKYKEEYLQHVKPEIVSRLMDHNPITWDEWQALAANTYERELCYGHMSPDCLLKTVRHFLDNVTSIPKRFPVQSTYEEALVHILLPLLLGQIETWRAHIYEEVADMLVRHPEMLADPVKSLQAQADAEMLAIANRKS